MVLSLYEYGTYCPDSHGKVQQQHVTLLHSQKHALHSEELYKCSNTLVRTGETFVTRTMNVELSYYEYASRVS